jgi:hypothetical protein
MIRHMLEDLQRLGDQAERRRHDPLPAQPGD